MNNSEKTGYEANPQIDDGLTTSIDRRWSYKEELTVRLKVDASVLPLLFLGLLVFQLDRMNLASALTGGFATDIQLTQSTINLGNQLMFMGIVVWEIPCNMALQRLGPSRWIPAQVFVFGLIATLQIFIRGRTGFLITRLALGFAEAGYIPGAVYTLSTWYTRRELAKRVAIFFFGMFGGNAISPLIASGILKLNSARGLRGWQWLFLSRFLISMTAEGSPLTKYTPKVEGLFTILVSFLLAFCLPNSPEEPQPLLSSALTRFSSPQKEILQARLEEDDQEVRNGAQGLRISLKLVWKTVSDYRRWPHFVSTFAVFSCWSSLTTYTPSIMVSLGFDTISANALAAVGAFIALGVVFIFAYISDKTNLRGVTVIAAQLCFLVTLIAAHEALPKAGRWGRWGLWTAINAFAVGYHPIHNSWVQLNCRDPRERSISIAMWVMSAISGLMVGTQYYQGDDSPLYLKGLRTQIIMVSVGIMFASIQVLIYVTYNKRVAQGKHSKLDGLIPMVFTP